MDQRTRRRILEKAAYVSEVVSVLAAKRDSLSFEEYAERREARDVYNVLQHDLPVFRSFWSGSARRSTDGRRSRKMRELRGVETARLGRRSTRD